MKRKMIVLLMALVMTLGVSSCTNGGKQPKANEEEKQTQVAEEESSKDIISSDDSEKAINDLIAKENKVFEAHQELWDKVFNAVEKDGVQDHMDSGEAYIEFLTTQLENQKASFTDEEYNALKDDIQKVKEIEEKIEEYEEK